MITLERALHSQVFHREGSCTKTVGPRGGVTIKREVWHRSGRTQTWKRQPQRFSVPIKHGLWLSTYLTNSVAPFFHAEEDCPLGPPQVRCRDCGHEVLKTEAVHTVGAWLCRDCYKARV